jgi:hypothetical protein
MMIQEAQKKAKLQVEGASRSTWKVCGDWPRVRERECKQEPRMRWQCR